MQFDYGLAKLHLGDASGAKEPLERASKALPSEPLVWYHLGLAVTETDITRHAAFVAKRMPELVKTSANGFRPVIQLDDGWMPRWQRWGDWSANPEQFPSGLRALTTSIHRHRLAAGKRR